MQPLAPGISLRQRKVTQWIEVASLLSQLAVASMIGVRSLSQLQCALLQCMLLAVSSFVPTSGRDLAIVC